MSSSRTDISPIWRTGRSDGLPHDTAYYLAHTVDLVDQARRKIRGYQSASIVGGDTIWRFMTRAAYNNMVRRKAFKDAPAHVAFVDECHMGGVASRQPKVQFPGIVATSDKVVWIYATSWEMDKQPMGARDGATSQLPFDEAFRLGILNNTDIVRVDCSLDMRIRLADDRRPLHRAERDEYHVVGEDAGEQDEQITRITREIGDRGLRVSDAPTLVGSHHPTRSKDHP